MADLAIDRGMSQFATNHPTACADLAITEAIDKLTEQLAAFCFKHLERSVDPSSRDLNNDVDVNGDRETFEDELSVSISIKGYNRILSKAHRAHACRLWQSLRQKLKPQNQNLYRTLNRKLLHFRHMLLRPHDCFSLRRTIICNRMT